MAGLLHTDANNYLSLLAGLGNECLGAIKITDENNEVVNADYQKLTIDEVSQLAREGAMETAELVTKSHLSLTGASGKVLETPIIPFDQSPIYRKNLTPVAALNFPGTLYFCTFRISHRKLLRLLSFVYLFVHFQVNFFLPLFAYLQSLSLRNL